MNLLPIRSDADGHPQRHVELERLLHDPLHHGRDLLRHDADGRRRVGVGGRARRGCRRGCFVLDEIRESVREAATLVEEGQTTLGAGGLIPVLSKIEPGDLLLVDRLDQPAADHDGDLRAVRIPVQPETQERLATR